MRKPSVVTVLLILSWVFFLGTNRPQAQQAIEPPIQQWEYLKSDAQNLKVWGEKGWEAYAVVAEPNASWGYYLKRPKLATKN